MKPKKKTALKKLKKLAEGGQGEVFLVERGTERLALKLYNAASGTQEQKNIISYLISAGVPVSSRADKFVWPIELVELEDSDRFGYLMPLINTDRYITLRDVMTGKAPHPGYGIIAELCRQLAESFRDLHGKGFCYRDISDNNFYFDPGNGDILICDNDNCMVDQMQVGNIEGTAGFMAPEVMTGKTFPSTLTDQHSLAVLMFKAWHWHHPMHGLKEYNIGCFDEPAHCLLYGTEPVFIFDPHDRTNALPNDTGYRSVPKHWNVLPTFMRRLFTQAFTKGLTDPNARVTELEWISAFSRLLDARHVCPACKAENFWDHESTDTPTCWNRRCTLKFPFKLALRNNPANSILIDSGRKLTTFHLGERSSSRLIGMVEAHPSEANVFILRNMTGEPWQAMLSNQTSCVPEAKAVVLSPGVHIHIEGYELIVTR